MTQNACSTGCAGQSYTVRAGDNATFADVQWTHSVCMRRLLALQRSIWTHRLFLSRCAVYFQSSVDHYVCITIAIIKYYWLIDWLRPMSHLRFCRATKSQVWHQSKSATGWQELCTNQQSFTKFGKYDDYETQKSPLDFRKLKLMLPVRLHLLIAEF